jgi:hypothetical protein
MRADVEMIQPGWTVFDADGVEIGTVIDATRPEIRVKKRGLLGGELSIPRTAVIDVETGRVELNRKKSDLS